MKALGNPIQPWRIAAGVPSRATDIWPATNVPTHSTMLHTDLRVPKNPSQSEPTKQPPQSKPRKPRTHHTHTHTHTTRDNIVFLISSSRLPPLHTATVLTNVHATRVRWVLAAHASNNTTRQVPLTYPAGLHSVRAQANRQTRKRGGRRQGPCLATPAGGTWPL